MLLIPVYGDLLFRIQPQRNLLIPRSPFELKPLEDWIAGQW
jgi:hypothetical protein